MQSEAAGATWNPWFQPPDDPVVLPTVKDKDYQKTGSEKVSVKVWLKRAIESNSPSLYVQKKLLKNF